MNSDEAHRFYLRKEWEYKREQILERDHYECQDCRMRIMNAAKTGTQLSGWQNHIHRATCVHHIIELRERPDLALSDDNLVSLCPMCHNIRHGRTAYDFNRRRKPKKKIITEEKW